MTWDVAGIKGGWRDWTPLFSNGTDQWDASYMTKTGRFTVVEGTVYAFGRCTLDGVTNQTNYGTGTGMWQLWTPSEMPGYPDASSGGRHVGTGYVYSGVTAKSAILMVNAVNTFDGFYYFNMIKSQAAGGGNWAGGIHENIDFNRANLSALADGTNTIVFSWYMKYIAKSTYSG